MRDSGDGAVAPGRLRQLKALRDPRENLRAVGVLGCMAERLKGKLLETDGLADVVCGPTRIGIYRDYWDARRRRREGTGRGRGDRG